MEITSAPSRLLARLFLYCIFICTPVIAQGQSGAGAGASEGGEGAVAKEYPIVIVGGGASGTAAAITAARLGQEVLLIEAGPWVGGMLTAAGVSAIDGNHHIASGIYREFRDSLRSHYGGAEALATGWVSHTLFEPKVGQRILRAMVAAEPLIDLRLNTTWSQLSEAEDRWRLTIENEAGTEIITAGTLIDATELGDLAAAAGVPYDVGMDAAEDSGETFAPAAANDIIQDLTFVATLKDFGPAAAPPAPRPAGYDPALFHCACDTADPADPAGGGKPRIDCEKMLGYGKLPGGRYMVNWPKCGNDYYANLIEADAATRDSLILQAKLRTLSFVYFLQNELGFDHLGIDPEQYPTEDGLPLIPYHRESRRIRGVARFNVHDLTDPFGQPLPLYRTSVATGDYPIDHHHQQRGDAPNIAFIQIKAPAYGLPLGTLLPRGVPNLIVAEKSISVSNIVNGATRLQPVVLGIGQAAGTLAAIANEQNLPPGRVSVRSVQRKLLEQGVALLPYIDVTPGHPAFAAIQSVTATGILRGTGVPYKWANQMWFYPDRPVSEFELVEGLRDFYPTYETYYAASGAALTRDRLEEILNLRGRPGGSTDWRTASAGLPPTGPLTRAETAVALHRYLAPFDEPIDHQGRRTNK